MFITETADTRIEAMVIVLCFGVGCAIVAAACLIAALVLTCSRKERKKAFFACLIVGTVLAIVPLRLFIFEFLWAPLLLFDILLIVVYRKKFRKKEQTNEADSIR